MRNGTDMRLRESMSPSNSYSPTHNCTNPADYAMRPPLLRPFCTPTEAALVEAYKLMCHKCVMVMAYVCASWFMCISFCVARFRLMLYLSLCFTFHVYAGTLCFMFTLTRIVMSTLYVSVYACFMVHVIRRSSVCFTLRGNVLCSIFIGRVDASWCMFMFHTYVVCYIFV